MKLFTAIPSLRRQLGVFLAALVAASPALATTYYIDGTAGSDSNNGTTTSTPWKTVGKILNHTYAAGDQILLQGGQTFSGTSLAWYSTASASYAKSSGTATNPVILGSYGTGRATLNITDTTSASSAAASNGILIYDVGGIKVQDLIIAGAWNATTQTGTNGSGISVYTDQYGTPANVRYSGVTITNCEIKGFKTGGIYVANGGSATTQYGHDGLTITYCDIHDNAHCGVTLVGQSVAKNSTNYAYTNLTFSYNKVYNNKGLVAYNTNHTGNGVLIGNTKNGTIEHNLVYGNGDLSTYVAAGPCGLWAWDSTNLVFQYNESHHNSTAVGTNDGDGFDLDGGCTYCTMQYNYSHDNRGVGFLIYEFGVTRGNSHDNILRYNISENDCSGTTVLGSILVGGSSSTATTTNNLIYNNTVYATKHPALYIYANGVTNVFANNLFYSNGSSNYAAYIANSSCALLQNNYWGGSYGLKIYYLGTDLTTLAQLRTYNLEVKNGVNYGLSVDPQLAGAGTGGTVGTKSPNTLLTYKVRSGSPLLGTGYDLSTLGYTIPTADFSGTVVPPSNIGASAASTSVALYLWAQTAGLTAAQRGVTDDPDGDGLPNLLEFAQGSDPTTMVAGTSSLSTVTDSGNTYPTFTFRRRHALSGIVANAEAIADLKTLTNLGVVELSSTTGSDGIDTVVARSAVSLSTQPRQFFRLTATEPVQ